VVDKSYDADESCKNGGDRMEEEAQCVMLTREEA